LRRTLIQSKLYAAITRFYQIGKALLFENTGYDFPVLMNAYGSEKRMCWHLGVKHLDDVAQEIESCLNCYWLPKRNHG
jgi:4-hydroxy-3-polyprenylbenzoate decarboxylase